MTCCRPLRMYWTGRYTDNGKREYVFSYVKAYKDNFVDVPCGNCAGCIQDRLRNMAMRMNDEASMYQRNCFITLTVDDEHMNDVFPDGSLRKAPFQAFAKRLRKCQVGDYIERPRWLPDGRKWNYRPIRICYCGEYGEHYKRPHYHAILFNFDFPDKKMLGNSGNLPIYTSEILERLWPYGYSTVGSVTFGSCAYVAGYVLKKSGHVEDYVDKETGLVKEREFVVYPRGFGLGRMWFDRYASDIYNYDRRVLKGGVMVRPPKYYDKLFSLRSPEDMASLRKGRFGRQIKAPKVDLIAKEEIIRSKQKHDKEKRNAF